MRVLDNEVPRQSAPLDCWPFHTITISLLLC